MTSYIEYYSQVCDACGHLDTMINEYGECRQCAEYYSKQRLSLATCGGCGAYGKLGKIHVRNGEECGEYV